jgi:integrase
MGTRKNMSGLTKRGGIWHIDKQFNGRRICRTTGKTERKAAEGALKKLMSELDFRDSSWHRPEISFGKAAVKWAADNQDRKSIDRDIQDIDLVLPMLGDLPLRAIHQRALEPFIQERRDSGRASSTVKRTLSTVTRILNAAHTVYRDDWGNPWLSSVPKFFLPEWGEARKRIGISIDEQACLLEALSEDLRDIAHFILNTGLRESEVRALRWGMEENSQGNSLVFKLPKSIRKNKRELLVFCNDIASRIVNKRRLNGSEWVFARPDGGQRAARLSSSGWRNGRLRAMSLFEQRYGGSRQSKLDCLKVHDLRHTFAERLREQGINMDTCGDLLGHAGRGVTAHYCRAKSTELINAVKTLDRYEVPKKSRTGNVIAMAAHRKDV